MPDIIPLRSFFYKEAKKDESKLKNLIAPPYDVISKEEEQELKKHKDNICHIILPESYKKAGEKLNQMIEDNTLICGQDRCIVIYGIDYTRTDTGEKISRYGFVGLLKLVDILPANNGVIPHEATFSKYTEDRYNLIKETDANFSPIFMIYNGNGSANKVFEKYTKEEPFLKTMDRDGFTHKIWEVWKKKDIEKFQKIINKHNVIIADGHHRYTTSLRYSKNGGCKYIMALFIDFNDPGLIIYTSHRLIHQMPVNSLEEVKERLEKRFEFINEIDDVDELKSYMENHRGEHVFGLNFNKKFLIINLKDSVKPEEIIKGKQSKEWKNLNLPILHEILFKDLGIDNESISFIKGIKNGIKSVNEGKAEALFVVNPTTLEEVHKITHLGEIMPQKSTYFYPKPLSGLIVHKHTEKIE